MANQSNWKGSERKAAQLFPSGKRRPRVGGTYALIADDIIWCFQEDNDGKRVTKRCHGDIAPVYVEVKKRASSEMITHFRRSEKKYIRKQKARLVLVTHVKGEKRQFVLVDGDFFKELLRFWCIEHELPV